ncbi:phage GP46 family protein [Bradyrhizobium sp. 31Argb]|uniref:phage GP46 family protein n=1 Tax=Bradyrhizobium sp. 31Argb TaxID=3141247 RepID=UPI003747BD16
MAGEINVPDIRLVQNNVFPKYSVTVDWSLLDNGTLDDTQALATAVIVALGTDALADKDDILPDPDSTDRAGWWGNMDAELLWNGWPIGSKLWLLRRSKIDSPASRNGATVVLVEQYIRDAIQPFVDRRICTGFDVWVSRIDKQRINALIRIYRGPEREIELRYAVLWDALAGS